MENISEKINLNFGNITLNGTLVSFDEKLLDNLKLFRNGIDFMLKLYGYEEGQEIKPVEPSTTNPEMPIIEYDPIRDSVNRYYKFHGYDNKWIEDNIIPLYGEIDLLYMGLYVIAKDEFKYPNLFFEKVTNGLMAPRKIGLDKFWMDLSHEVKNEVKNESNYAEMLRVAEKKIHEIEDRVENLFHELKKRCEGYDFVNVSTLSKRLDMFRGDVKLSEAYKKLSYYKKSYESYITSTFPGAKVKNTSNRGGPMYFIKTADLDKLFELITSEPCTVKSFYTMVFGFRTRFIGDDI